MTLVTNPYPIFLDGRGMLLDGGFISIGVPNADPKVPANQIALFSDAALTIPLVQPLRTLGGVLVSGRNKIFVHTAATDYAITVQDAQGDLVYSVASVNVGGVASQPLSNTLTALAAISSTVFGQSLLTMANSAALKAATGIPDCLPLAGGIVSGNVVRGGAGVHIYYVNPAMISGRKFGPSVAGSADLTSLPGDEQAFYT